MTTELKDRFAQLRVDVDPATEERHLEATFAALRDQPDAVVGPRRRVRVLRPITVVALATLLMIPVAALASDDAIPGDALYPVKRTFEWVWGGFDESIAARHRVEEVEEALRRGEPAWRIAELLDEAEDVARGSGSELGRRLERVRNEVAARFRGENSGRAETTATIPTTDVPDGGSPTRSDTGRASEERPGDDPLSDPAHTTVASTLPPADEPPRHQDGSGQGDAGSSPTSTLGSRSGDGSDGGTGDG